jgi:hypothetical protein
MMILSISLERLESRENIGLLLERNDSIVVVINEGDPVLESRSSRDFDFMDIRVNELEWSSGERATLC